MRQRKSVLRTLGAGMGDCYTQSELYCACEIELFSKGKKMDTALLKEALYTLDKRPDEEVAPHSACVWAGVCERIQPFARISRRKFALIAVTILLFLALAGTCVAWSIYAGVLTFPSIMLPWLPQAQSGDAQSLVIQNLATVEYAHCELKVREAAFDGHQLRVVYSVRDTRLGAGLTEEEKTQDCITAGRLDGLGCCDFLTVNGSDVFLEDTFQCEGETAQEMLYYLSANIPENVALGKSIQIGLPIGQPRGTHIPRYPENVMFSLDISASRAAMLYAKSTTTAWGNTRVILRQAAFSPLHGYIKVATYPIDTSKPYDKFLPALFTMTGEPVEYEWYTTYGETKDGGREMTLQYIPDLDWPKQMLLAGVLSGGAPDREHCMVLSLLQGE